MAGTARSVFTRLLPWAALALMTVMFFVQVKARHRAEHDAAEAKDDLQAVREDRVLGDRPTLSPLAPSRIEAAAIGSEIAGLRRQLEAAHEELAAARSAREALLAKAERTEALRVTASARAGALDAQLEADAEAAAKRIADLEGRLKTAKTELERRQSPVKRWVSLAAGGGPDALSVIRAEAPKATNDDMAELRTLWHEGSARSDTQGIAEVLAHVPVSPASAALAGEMLVACESPRRAGRLLAQLARHTGHEVAVTLILSRGSNELREDLVAHLAAGSTAWDEPGRTRVQDSLAALLAEQDTWTLEIAIRALPRLKMTGYEADLLPFLTHADAQVRIAAIYALQATADRKSAARTLQAAVVGLLEDKAFDVRMAGLFLAQELAGEKRSLAFGSSDQAVAKEIARLKQKLATLAKE